MGIIEDDIIVIEVRQLWYSAFTFARSSLQATLSPPDFAHICCTIESKALKYKNRISCKLDKKFNNLKRNMKYLNCLEIVSSTYVLLGRYNHSLSLDFTIMVSKNCPTIGEYVVTIFVTH